MVRKYTNKLPTAYKNAKNTFDSLFRKRTAILPPDEHEYRHNYTLIQRSGYFDEAYYLRSNPDVAASGMDPLGHYVKYGGVEGRNPSAKFNSEFYLKENADVREMRINPLAHFLEVGLKEGRKPKSPKLTKPQKSTRKGPKKVDIINVNFYDWDGEVLYKGGAERYVFDLACIVKELGHKPRILQNANQPFVKHYRGIEVVGIVTGAQDTTGPLLRKMSKAFNHAIKGADLVIASPLDLACEISGVPVIGINHGIHWDSKMKKLHNNRTSDYKEIFDALERISLGVCVDTNFINWTRTYDYGLGSKLKYVPNYYDQDEFLPSDKEFDGRLAIMYPRRLYDARGIYITLEAFEYLLKKYDEIDLLLVGQTDDTNVKTAVEKLIKKYKQRVTLEEYDMEDMYKAYKKSNVVLIPTRYAEGTSLSCLEAMATNNVLISTNIGGLPNLIVDGFNGVLIDPSSDALIEAVESIIKDREYAKKLAANALEMVKVFEKDYWSKRWIKLLEKAI